MSKLKWYADNSELTVDKGMTPILVFGGVIVDADAEAQINEILTDVKLKYGLPHLPVKWNFKDLETEYKSLKKKKEFETLKLNSHEWRKEIFERSLDIDFTIILACTEKYKSQIPLRKLKVELTAIAFSQSLMRVGLFAKNDKRSLDYEVILDWPDSSNPKPFNDEFFSAFNFGRSYKNVPYHSGNLKDLKFNSSLYYAKSTHSNLLQFADLIIGASKDFAVKVISGDEYHSLGYELTELLISKYRGYPHDLINRGFNYAPKNSNYEKIKFEFSKIVNR